MASVTCPDCNAYVSDAFSLCSRCGHNLESETPTPDEQARRQLVAETSSAMDYLDAATRLSEDDRLNLRARYLGISPDEVSAHDADAEKRGVDAARKEAEDQRREVEEQERLAEERRREAEETERRIAEADQLYQTTKAEREARERQRKRDSERRRSTLRTIAALLVVPFIVFGGPFLVTALVLDVIENPLYIAAFVQLAAWVWLLTDDWRSKKRSQRS